MDKPLTPEQIAAIKAKRRRRFIEAWLRWQEDIRRRIEEARRRRHKFLFWLLVGLLITQTLNNLFMLRPIIYRPDPIPKPSHRPKQQGRKLVEKSDEWQPSPENDFAPQLGEHDYCDGYSRDVWEEYADEKGWRPGSRKSLKKAWERDPERELFPERYKDGWDHRPSLFELTREFFDRYQRSVALKALLIVAPPEARQWLEEVSVVDPAQIRLAFADQSDEIAENFKKAAIRWAEEKRKEAEDALKHAKEMNKSKENGVDDDQDDGGECDI